MSKRGENIYKRKDGRYEGRYVRGQRVDGRTVFGYIYAYTYAEVKKALTLAKATFAQNKPVRFIGKGTLSDFLKWWLENTIRDRVKTSTYAQYQERIYNHIIPQLGGTAVCMLQKEEIHDMINSLSDKGLSFSTIKNIVGLLRSAMKKAVELHLANDDPCDGVTLPEGKVKESQALERVEQIELEKSAVGVGQDVELAVFLSLYTGLRIGEICALRWRDVDLSTGILTVRGTLQRVRIFDGGAAKTALMEGLPKSKSSQRRVPLPVGIVDKLRGYRNGASGDAFVLTNTIKPVEPRTLRARFQKTAAATHLSIPFHSLRHTYAARCLENNFDIQTLSELLGHATANTTMTVYAHSVLEHKRLLTSRMRILSEIYEPSNTPSAAYAIC